MIVDTHINFPSLPYIYLFIPRLHAISGALEAWPSRKHIHCRKRGVAPLTFSASYLAGHRQAPFAEGGIGQARPGRSCRSTEQATKVFSHLPAPSHDLEKKKYVAREEIALSLARWGAGGAIGNDSGVRPYYSRWLRERASERRARAVRSFVWTSPRVVASHLSRSH